MNKLFYDGCGALTWVVFRTFTRWKVTGRENVPAFGPLIVASNHMSLLDPPMLGKSVPRRIAFLAKEELYRNALVSWAFRWYGAIPLDRNRLDPQALGRALAWLERDGALGVFPEGHRNGGQLIEARPGVALLALRSGAPILPVGIIGSERIRGPKDVVLGRRRLEVRIGQAFSLPALEGDVPRAQLMELTTLVMQRIAALLPERYQGRYRLSPTTSRPAH